MIVGDVQRFPVSTERDKNVMRARRRAIELLGANEWKFVGEADIGTQRRTDIDHRDARRSSNRRAETRRLHPFGVTRHC
ncbi:hypothetical protein [Burkholderia savannae]|uniref:hypothetical protein n=1 Tax=Burkholderia savannae TaxID=1637837 RepID=UPI0012E3F3B4|nr:hypothetical protein [Burkholderia savannae]